MREIGGSGKIHPREEKIYIQANCQSAKALKRDDLIKQNQKIEHDFQAYQKEPSKQNLATLKGAKKIIQ